MRVRVVSRTLGDPPRGFLVVQKWIRTAPSLDDAWQDVLNFQAHEYAEACEFAMNLSRSKESATQAAVFEDGAEVKPGLKGCDPNSVRAQQDCSNAVAGVNSVQPSPFSSAERPMTTGPDA